MQAPVTLLSARSSAHNNHLMVLPHSVFQPPSTVPVTRTQINSTAEPQRNSSLPLPRRTGSPLIRLFSLHREPNITPFLRRKWAHLRFKFPLLRHRHHQPRNDTLVSTVLGHSDASTTVSATTRAIMRPRELARSMYVLVVGRILRDPIP
ncbi:hypothetical protein JAAARDRAFT_519100 [Jaapia argillacea MUCL 33604]|uniref:Uncharacterized protein n=1 Tax=Jaapia argillacea MUCL 33604 TaxID=933084 RepID=A0A067Q691_9AGAM|nr:hypothetical protein JAAARDRAFT_519100 [Jaapia argillacea MUCL 33604]